MLNVPEAKFKWQKVLDVLPYINDLHLHIVES